MEKAKEPNDVRHHSDAPAEGETEGWEFHETGQHSQDPAEGPDVDEDAAT
ncbi:hypothetical protein AB6813_21115 [bacterium RCC_150]